MKADGLDFAIQTGMELRRHHIYLIVAVLAFGLLIEWAKTHKKVENQQDREIRAVMNRLQEQPYGAAPEFHEPAVPQAPRPSPTYHFPENNTFSHPAVEASPAPSVSPSPSPSGSADAEKKKKKKKVAVTGVGLPAGIEDTAAPPPAPTPSGDKFGDFATGAVTPNNPNAQNQMPNSVAPANNTANTTTKSIKEWEALLENQASSALTQKFVTTYKNGSVNSATFYAVVKDMLGDSRQDIQLQGVQAAAAIHSYQSFNLLVSVTTDTKSQGSVAQAAETALNSYDQMASLTILETVLRTPGAAAADIQAANFITNLATTAAGGGTATETPAAAATQFAPLKSLLTSLSKQTGNPILAQAAQRALQAIQSLIG